MQVLIEMHASAFQILKLFGVPQVESSGAFPVAATNNRIQLFLSIRNIGNSVAVFQVSLTQCCDSGKCSLVKISLKTSTRIVIVSTRLT